MQVGYTIEHAHVKLATDMRTEASNVSKLVDGKQADEYNSKGDSALTKANNASSEAWRIIVHRYEIHVDGHTGSTHSDSFLFNSCVVVGRERGCKAGEEGYDGILDRFDPRAKQQDSLLKHVTSCTIFMSLSVSGWCQCWS